MGQAPRSQPHTLHSQSSIFLFLPVPAPFSPQYPTILSLQIHLSSAEPQQVPSDSQHLVPFSLQSLWDCFEHQENTLTSCMQTLKSSHVWRETERSKTFEELGDNMQCPASPCTGGSLSPAAPFRVFLYFLAPVFPSCFCYFSWCFCSYSSLSPSSTPQTKT